MTPRTEGAPGQGDNAAYRAEVLKGAFIFSALNQGEVQELAGISHMRRFAAEEFIFLEGDPPDYFYVLGAGKVRVVKHSASGKDFVVAFFEAGEIFGEVAVFENKPYPASAQAAAETTVIAVPKKEFLGFLAERPQVALRLISILGGRLREAQSRLKDLAIERVEQRLANALVMLSSRLGSTLPFTRQDIADMTGTTTETAIRTMGHLKERGIISTARGKITIVNSEKLRLLAEGRPRLP
jgi:CRP/FNR family transcriptional regulator